MYTNNYVYIYIAIATKSYCNTVAIHCVAIASYLAIMNNRTQKKTFMISLICAFMGLLHIHRIPASFSY